MPKSEEDFIPAAVKKQGEAAENAQKHAIDPEAAPTESPAPEPAKPTNPEPARNKTKPVAPEANVKAKPNAGDFEQKYNVLQGMYNKETHELKMQIDQMNASMENQQKIIENLNTVLESLPQQAAQAPAPAASANVLNSRDFDTYGDEFVGLIDLVNNIAARLETLEKRPAQAQVDPQLIEKVNALEQTTMISAKDRFYEALAQAVPDWGTQNNDPGFLQWLKEIDPISQVHRETLLKYAFDRWNHTQVIALFNGYKQSQGQSITPEATPTKEGLESQVVPETTGSGDGETTPKQKYSTKEEFLAAQTHFTRGRITEADFDKIANSYQAGIAAGVYK